MLQHFFELGIFFFLEVSYLMTYHQIQGKFYELYELDAEIGHKELDWKMTLSGVGKCRQVSLKHRVVYHTITMFDQLVN